jgi:hypothetical protein
VRSLEHSLFELFLALDTVACPRHRIKPLGIDLFAAGDAFAETAFANAIQRAFHHRQQLAVVIALMEKELLVVRTTARPSAAMRETVRRSSCCRVSNRFLNVSSFFLSISISRLLPPLFPPFFTLPSGNHMRRKSDASTAPTDSSRQKGALSPKLKLAVAQG